MAAETYSLRALVLRKTKLGETDAIVTLLAEDGRQVRAVAKGARKPSSAFASRLELFSEVDLLLVRGKSLDIVKEARLLDAHLGVRSDMEHAAAAAPIIDVMARLSQPDLAAPRLYALTSSALSHAQAADASSALAVCAAHLLKAFAFSGFRPSFDTCVICGSPVVGETAAAPQGDSRRTVSFSPAEGGVVCNSCLLLSDARPVATDVLAWAHFLLMSPFDMVVDAHVERRISFEVLHLCQAWECEHVGGKLKSLEFLFTCGLF